MTVLGHAPRAPAFLETRTLLAFLKLQLSAAAFGCALIALIVATHLAWPPDAPLARYDALLIAALAIQVVLIASGWETWEEAKAIFAFHIVGTVMELFKTAAGAWVYPEPSLFRIGEVPLFTGFMYSAVGSYIARSWRALDLRFENHPPLWMAYLAAAAIYVNFFAHHYVWDIRYALFGATIALFGGAWATGVLAGRRIAFPLVGFFIGVGVLIWIAENAATWSHIWLYPNQTDGWRPVSATKIGSWYLLMIVSFVLVAAIHRPDKDPTVADDDGRASTSGDAGRQLSTGSSVG